MPIRGFLALDSYVQTLPCPTKQALSQLRKELKRQDFRSSREVKEFEPRSLEISGKVFFPFQGENYWLVTKIVYNCQIIKVLEILRKKDLFQEFPEAERLIAEMKRR